jgi:hypothetical protein
MLEELKGLLEMLEELETAQTKVEEFVLENAEELGPSQLMYAMLKVVLMMSDSIEKRYGEPVSRKIIKQSVIDWCDEYE